MGTAGGRTVEGMAAQRFAPARPLTDPTGTPSAPPVPRARRALPGGRDLRLALGVVLVLASVVLGARVLAAADDRAEVWALAGPLAAGTTVSADDLVPVGVALEDLTPYVEVGTDVEGMVLLRDVGADELLPAAALVDADAAARDRRWVTVPVDPLHAPPGLARGERVDVYVTPADGAALGDVEVVPVLVLAGALVADPGGLDPSGLSDRLGVVLDVAAADADRAVAAARAGDVDLVRAP
jgi:hypothetical protein